MDDDVEEYFSRPAKRRRISCQGASPAYSSLSPGDTRDDRGRGSRLCSPSSAGSAIQARGGMSSQANAKDEDEELEIVNTSDNEELLLEDTYDNFEEDATTILARSTSLPANSPYPASRLSFNNPPIRAGNGASPRTLLSQPSPTNDKAIKGFELLFVHCDMVTADGESLPKRLQNSSVSSSVFSNITIGSDMINSSPAQHNGSPAKSNPGERPILSRNEGSETEAGGRSPNTGEMSLEPLAPQSQPPHLYASQTSRSNSQSHLRSKSSPKINGSRNSSKSPHSFSPAGPSQSSPRTSLFPSARQSSLTSTSLSPPPSPPRRRTRESNKTFAPYTAYRKQYGDAALAELYRIEQVEANRRVFGQRSTAVDDDEDQTWVASQSQMDEESQAPTQNYSEMSLNSQLIQPSTKARAVVPKGIKRSRPDVPVPIWESRRTHRLSIPLHNSVPLKPLAPNAPRRFLDPDGSPVRPGAVRYAKPGGSSKNPTPEKHSTAHRPTQRAILVTAEGALRQLYGDESDEEDPDMLTQDIQVNDFNDSEVLEDFADAGVAGAPSTDADSDMDAELEVTRPESGEGEGSGREGSSSGSSHSSDMDGEVRLDRKRKRILARVLPAVMIKKSAQQQRERELERQRKRRDMERARREAKGLGESDPDELSDIIIRPGQSKTLRVPQERITSWNSRNKDSDELADITSDRESLDNEDPVVIGVSPEELSSDEDLGWPGRYESADPMDFEAKEDNTFFDGCRSRISNARTPLVPRRKGPINRRDPYNRLRQSRIDRMLNSTSGTQHKPRHRRSSKAHHGSSSRAQGRQKAGHDRTARKWLPPNTHITSAHPHVHIQTQLPFEPIQQDHVVAHESGRKAEKRSTNEKSSSSRGKGTISTHPSVDGFAELFDVLTSRNPPSRRKFPSPPISALVHAPSSKDTVSKSKSRLVGAILGTNNATHPSLLAYGNSVDPDEKIEISLNSALAFGMQRQRQGFSFGPSSWLAQGKLLDLVRVLCGTSEPARPLPCYVSTLRFDATTSILDLQLQLPTVCDLVFMAVQKPSNEEETMAAQQLMRFICLFVSWSITENEEDAKSMLDYVAIQIRALMDRVEEHLVINGRSGKDFDSGLLSVHWFAVEISNRIAKATACIQQKMNGEIIVLNDATTDRYTVTLMARLLEFGIRRTTTAFQRSTEESHEVERYALELWIALVHVTVLQPTTLEDSKAGSNAFWRLVLHSLDECSRQFASVAHETEFIFATIFSLCSLSSLDALGCGQVTRALHGYWPIVCRALGNIELSPETDRSKRLSQGILAAKDTYIGMLFARCNVLAFRWDWSLQDSQEVKPLFEMLRGALKDRKFMNLLHEQSDFPYFITRRDLRQLHEFDAKDSIQTIVIKLMLRKVEEAKEDMKSAKKWISLLAFTSALEFTKEKPPTQKELSTLFNQFTIKFVLLYVNPDANNVRAVINGSKKIVNFQNADHRSRLVCIRSAMIFGRFCRHFRLPLDEAVQWMSEMGVALLDEHRILGIKATTHQKKETSTLCALLLASLRDVLQTDFLDESNGPQELTMHFYLENSIGMLDFVAKLLPITRDWGGSLAEEAALLLMTIFRSRDSVFPPPKPPAFPPAVAEEESQEDYGFDPIDVDAFTKAMKTHEEDASKGELWVADSELAIAISGLISPVAALIGRLGYAEPAERKKSNVELWMQCWARIGAICHAHDLKSWDYFLQRGPDALGRVADLEWRQQTEPMFLLEILRSDMRIYVSDRERFILGWFITIAAGPDHILPDYTYTLFRVDGFKHFLFEGVPFRRDLTEDDYDEVAYAESRLNIVESVFNNLNRNYQSQVGIRADLDIVRRNVEALEAISETLKLMRHNISNAPEDVDEAFRDYAAFCRNVVASLKSLEIGEDARLSSVLSDPWVLKLDQRLNPQ